MCFVGIFASMGLYSRYFGPNSPSVVQLVQSEIASCTSARPGRMAKGNTCQLIVTQLTLCCSVTVCLSFPSHTCKFPHHTLTIFAAGFVTRAHFFFFFLIKFLGIQTLLCQKHLIFSGFFSPSSFINRKRQRITKCRVLAYMNTLLN